MNRKVTPLLLALALVLGLMSWWTARTHGDGVAAVGPGGNRVLTFDPQELTQIRVRQDYWNSFALSRAPDGQWQLVEPSREPARIEQVRRLLDTVALLPVLATIDSPSNDAERYRQYGLWEPRLRLTLTMSDKERTVVFGKETDDHSGSYCAVEGRDEIYVTTSEAVQSIATSLETYRETATASKAAAPER